MRLTQQIGQGGGTTPVEFEIYLKNRLLVDPKGLNIASVCMQQEIEVLFFVQGFNKGLKTA